MPKDASVKLDIKQIEQQRIALQAALDAAKHARDRNKMGQFATPTNLARDILAYGCRLLGPRKKIRFLDPAIGTGSFYSALRAVAPATRIDRCTGYEIDPHYAGPAFEFWKSTSLQLCIDDFTTAAPPLHTKDKANLIICNPPYVRHHYIPAERKQALQHMVSERTGLHPNGLSGLYCYFLWLAHAWLAPRGVAGWLIPSEWMDVNYGTGVKQYLLDHVRLLRVHRFDAKDTQFDDALVSSSIIWFRNSAPNNHGTIEFSTGGTLAAPRTSMHVTRTMLHSTRKWTKLSWAQPGHAKPHAPTLSDIFTIKRGIATGSNRFFVLSEPQIEEHRIAWQFLRPILPGPRYLPNNEIRARDDGTPDLDRRLFLLSTETPEDIIRNEFPRLWTYLRQGIEQGINKRYLCRHRKPWYAQENRPPAPLLCTYMGRKGDTGRPFRFILNRSTATAANVYLLLYPGPPLARAMEQDKDLLPRIWKALNELPIEILVGQGRVYGGGLHKLEPKELANTPLDALNIEIPLCT